MLSRSTRRLVRQLVRGTSLACPAAGFRLETHRLARAIAAAASLAATGAAVGATPASAATPVQAIANLNAQRASNGIPAGIVEVPAWSQACAQHNAYERANGGTLIHDEDVGRPGYTEAGAFAGANSVLAKGDSWDSANPWEHAPIHLHQLLHPRLAEMGVADGGGYTCATTHPGNTRQAPATPTTYTYPGPGTSFRFEETAAEGPCTPGEKIGIPQGTKTGPYLYVMTDGPWSKFAGARFTSASLVGPDGPVELRTVDNYTPGLEGYLPTGGELIPLRPLRPRQTYTASVNATVTESGTEAATPVSHHWSFTTVGRPANASVELGLAPQGGVRVFYRADSPAPARVSLLHPGGQATLTRSISKEQNVVVSLPPGQWVACFTVPAAGEWEGAQDCAKEPVEVVGHPRMRVGKPRLRKGKLSLALSTDPILRGRKITVTTRQVIRRDGRTRGIGAARRKTVTIRKSMSLRATMPRRGRGVRVEVRAKPFIVSGGRWASSTARRTYVRSSRR